MTPHRPALKQAERLADELLDLLGALRHDLVESESQRAELVRRVRVRDAELAAWPMRERELLHELAAVRAAAPGGPSSPERTGLGEGELRDAIAAARITPSRRPRWADDLLGAPEPGKP
jgi:hypothetical protein